MRTICLAMATAAVSLSLAAPISAQSNHKRSYSHQLQMQIEAGVNRGTISASENRALREELGRLLMLERRLSPNGINGREHARLTKASIALARDIRIATRNSNLRGEKQASWESGTLMGIGCPMRALPDCVQATGSAVISELDSGLPREWSICRQSIVGSMSTMLASITVTTGVGFTRLIASRR